MLKSATMNRSGELKSELEGVVERITFQNPDNGYTVAKFSPSDHPGEITITGTLYSLQPGEYLVLKGDWEEHPKFGRQFKVQGYKPHVPTTADGIEKFLSSGLVHGIGPVFAKRLVKEFGVDLLDIIEQDPDRLCEVPGIGASRCAKIVESCERHREIREIIIFLQTHGVSTSLAAKVYREYGDEALNILRTDPYRLADDIFGVGFKTADVIARKMGIPKDSPLRVRAAIKYVLKKGTESGNTFLPTRILLESVDDLTEAGEADTKEALAFLGSEGSIVIEDAERVFLKPFVIAEKYIAERGYRMASGRVKDYDSAKLARVIREVEEREKLSLHDTQRDAVTSAYENQLSIITGGPGTGKSTTLRILCRLFERLQKAVVLASPTGRAAKRLSEASGRDAYTIHRLLEFNPRGGGFVRNEDNPLQGDVFVIDEASMLDNMVCYHLLRALPRGARLVFVGDIDQLPSVGAGNILKDFIASGVVNTVRLSHIFRQAEHSSIVMNAHRFNEGKGPVFDIEGMRKDFRFAIADEPSEVVRKILSLISSEHLARFDILKDLQVLCPMHNGDAGARNLNQLLQEALNPVRGDEQLIIGGRNFRIGDRVMQLRNNYDKDVFNGDIGHVKSLDMKEREIIVRFDKPVHYRFGELDELQHAYAITVHKSQGSEYPVVIVPVTTQHFVMLQRNLIYTAVTRAKELCIIVGSKRALMIALKNDRLAHRHTWLKERLMGEGEVRIPD